MKSLLALYLLILFATAVAAQPYERRTLPPAKIPDIKEQIDKKRVELEREESMTAERLGYELAIAHYYVRSHVCPEESHFHDYTVWDEDRIADLILEKYGK